MKGILPDFLKPFLSFLNLLAFFRLIQYIQMLSTGKEREMKPLKDYSFVRGVSITALSNTSIPYLFQLQKM